MTDDIVTRLTNDIAFRLRLQAKVSNLYEIQHPHMVRIPTIYEEAADEIERLRKELSKWATTPPNRMVCATHGEMFMCFDDYMGGVYWCEGCRND